MHSVHSDQDILRVYLYGKLDLQSLFDAQRELMLHPEYPHKNSLWIFDDEFVCDFSSLGFADLIERIKRYYPIGATKQKAALIARTNTHYAILQMFCDEASYDGSPFAFKAFQEFDKAEQWLGVNKAG